MPISTVSNASFNTDVVLPPSFTTAFAGLTTGQGVAGDPLVTTPSQVSGGGQGGPLVFSQSYLAALSNTSAAWLAMKDVADNGTGQSEPINLSDQNSFFQIRALARAFVYARTGTASYKTDVQNACRDAIGTHEDAASNVLDARNLACARTLCALVIAADIVGMDNSLTGTRTGYTGMTWLAFLQLIRDFVFPAPHGGNASWDNLRHQHQLTSHNFGNMAGASMVAVTRYLDDNSMMYGLPPIMAVTQRWLGDRTKHQQFTGPGYGTSMQPSFVSLESSYGTYAQQHTGGPTGDSYAGTVNKLTGYVGINPLTCVGGPVWEGMPVSDVARDSSIYDGNYGGIDYSHGGDYTYGSFTAILTTLLMYEAAGQSPWTWSDSAPKRAMQWLDRAGMNPLRGTGTGTLGDHTAFTIDAKYGTTLAVVARGSAKFGRQFGFTDWLFP